MSIFPKELSMADAQQLANKLRDTLRSEGVFPSQAELNEAKTCDPPACLLSLPATRSLLFIGDDEEDTSDKVDSPIDYKALVEDWNKKNKDCPYIDRYDPEAILKSF